jgi:hypothetical protein
VDVPGEDAPDVITGDQLEQRGLVVYIVVLATDREVLEQQRRRARDQPAEITGEPLKACRPAVARLE